METLRELYRTGTGPSTRTAPLPFLDPATLYGSHASTGRGHLTDTVIKQAFGDRT